MQPLPPNAPQRVGDYPLLAMLGRGAMGSVYLARSRGGRPLAVKVARPELADNPQFRERFRREVEMARAVGGFWTAIVVDADPEADRPWMATEYVPGPNLQQVVVDQGPLPQKAVRRLAGGLAEALIAIHGAGLVHRDLKPSNVLLADDGPRVIDFGIARALEHSALTEAGIVFGTPGYLSPEQVVGEPVGPQSDVFALGSVLVFAATGEGPFGEGSTSALVYRVVHQEPDLSKVPPGLVPLIVPMLVRDPANRPTPERLLEAIGTPRADGSWLPDRVRTLVEARRTELRSYPGTPGDGGVPPGPTPTLLENQPPRPEPVKPPTLALSRESAQAAAASQAVPAVPAVKPPTKPASPPATADKRGKSVKPEGTRFATSRVAGYGWSAFYGAGVGMTGIVASVNSTPDPVKFAAIVACLGLLVTAARLFADALQEPLVLDVGAEGVTVSSGGQKQLVPWYAVNRIRVESHRSRPWLVVWLKSGAKVPEPMGRGSFTPHQGGMRMYPISHERHGKRRDRDVVELRSALAWYGGAAYDPH
ncbi:serine/threonine protein kinase [Actinosynnema pretiosum]|uniref:Serine/threonine protein kinase n=1 Tax=Actinosynnema pretiosum TaxID=42197 RepID=A0A290Z334_9PSEU|nr:serine/threonine protein kinase [Actinosynnema pretiosum]